MSKDQVKESSLAQHLQTVVETRDKEREASKHVLQVCERACRGRPQPGPALPSPWFPARTGTCLPRAFLSQLSASVPAAPSTPSSYNGGPLVPRTARSQAVPWLWRPRGVSPPRLRALSGWRGRSWPLASTTKQGSSSMSAGESLQPPQRGASFSAAIVKSRSSVICCGSCLRALLLAQASAFRPSHTSPTAFSSSSWNSCTGPCKRAVLRC